MNWPPSTFTLRDLAKKDPWDVLCEGGGMSEPSVALGGVPTLLHQLSAWCFPSCLTSNQNIMGLNDCNGEDHSEITYRDILRHDIQNNDEQTKEIRKMKGTRGVATSWKQAIKLY